MSTELELNHISLRTIFKGELISLSLKYYNYWCDRMKKKLSWNCTFWPLCVHEHHVMAMNSLYFTNHDNKVQGILKAFSNSIEKWAW